MKNKYQEFKTVWQSDEENNQQHDAEVTDLLRGGWVILEVRKGWVALGYPE